MEETGAKWKDAECRCDGTYLSLIYRDSIKKFKCSNTVLFINKAVRGRRHVVGSRHKGSKPDVCLSMAWSV